MATGLIKVTPEQMRAVNNTLNNKAQEWQNNVQNITQEVENMDSMWDGEGSEAFLQLYRGEDVPEFEKLRNFMLEYIAAINSAANRYDQGEGTVKGIVSKRR
ncbi:MAG: WXG100 family type VII secretion target [Firmicutes bacterium]|nr:WXG100 family type VII secretion target [Bacillota bacterium]